MKRNTVVCISVSIVVVVMFVASIILFFAALQKNKEADEKLNRLNSATLDEVTNEIISESQSTTNATVPLDVVTETMNDESDIVQETEQTEIITPTELGDFLMQNNTTAQSLYEQGCRQLVTVNTSASSAQVDFYQIIDNEWQKDDSMSCNGFVGTNGVTSDMHEGGYATPKGVYAIGDAFYIDQKPATGLNTFEITPDTYWVDDPDSQYYNKRVEGTANMDWNSAEHMIDYTNAYEYGFVIEYNTEAIYNAGSAIFFHVSYAPTAGCVGVDRSMVLKYLAVLEADSNPFIAIA